MARPRARCKQTDFAVASKPPKSDKSATTLRRLNRAVPLNEALGKTLDPALKKRGFATRDIIEHWKTVAPAPYDSVARPDKLSWPRGERGAEGAVLHLSCHPGHALALAHEGNRIAGAINRYFGYLLVAQVRLSATPFTPEAPPSPPPAPLDPDRRAKLDDTVSQVAQPELRDALLALGEAIAARTQRR